MAKIWGRETVRLVEVDQPRCALTYGESPCQAGLGVTGNHKCMRTRVTCQDPNNYDESDQITLKFSWDQPELSKYYNYAMPMIEGITTTPGAINVAGMDESSGGMGQREVVNIAMKDGSHSDLLTDPYREERITGEASLIESGTAEQMASLLFQPNSSANPRVTYSVGSGDDLDIPGDVTIEATIVAYRQLDVTACILRCGVGADNHFSLFYDGTNERIYFHWYDGSHLAVYAGSGDAPKYQKLHMVVTRKDNKVNFYVEGAPSGVADQAVTTPIGFPGQLAVGATGATIQGFTGLIGGVRVYSRAISAFEAAQHANHVFEDETGLVLRWDFNERTGTTATDLSGSGNDGTLSGSPLPKWRDDIKYDNVRLRLDDTGTGQTTLTREAATGKTLRLVGGSGSVISRVIQDFDETEKIAKVSERWPAPYLDLEGSPDDDAVPVLVLDFLKKHSAEPVWGNYSLTCTRAGNTATRINGQGKVEVVPANTLRWDYDPLTLQPRGLLCEDGQVQIALHTGDPTNAAYGLRNQLTVTTGVTAPDGSTNGVSLVATASSDPYHGQSIDTGSAIAGRTFTFSVWVWAPEGETALTSSAGLYIYGGGDVFNTPLTITSTPTRYRFTATFTGGATGNVVNIRVDPPQTAEGGYIGMTWYVWGYNCVESKDLTSYIPATTASVTRNTDRVDLSSSELMNQRESTILAEYNINELKEQPGTYAWVYNVNSSGSGRMTTTVTPTAAHSLEVSVVDDTGVFVVSFGPGTITAGRHKLAVRYAKDDFARSYDGGAVATDSAGTPPTSLTSISLGHSSGGHALNGHIEKLVVFGYGLANATLVELAANGASFKYKDFPIEFPNGTTEYIISDAFDPNERGSFWGKWLARNPYHVSYPVRVYTGTYGDPQSALSVRNYVIDRVEGPTNGKVKLVAKDAFTLIEQAKAVAPRASRGELFAGISAADMSFTVTPSEILDEDYPIESAAEQFYVAIGDECIHVTRSGSTFTVIERGALNTEPAAHDAEDLVQFVLNFEQWRPQDIAYYLLTQYSAVPAAWIDLAQWDIIAEPITQLYTGRIAEPTPVIDLIGELCQHARIVIWPDVSDGLIKLNALRPKASKLVIDDAEWVIGDQISVKRRDERRLTQVWVYYGQKAPTKALDDRRNYNSRLVSIDADAEIQYGVPKIHTIYSRWIPQFGRQQAQDVADGILQMFRNPPREVMLSAPPSRDGELTLSDVVSVLTEEVQDELGDRESFQTVVTEISADEDSVDLKLLETPFFEDTGDTTDRTIYIENTSYNLNLRTIHDTLYASVPTVSPTMTISFIVIENVYVGSTSTGAYSMRTGNWDDVEVNLTLTVDGRLQGKAGNGGQGGYYNGSVQIPGANGQAGGSALLIEHDITIDGSGEIFAGSGGSGGGGYGYSGAFVRVYYGGGGGAGSAGSDPGSGASGGPGWNGGAPGQPGTNGSTEAGGTGGNPGLAPFAGRGGHGVGPGLAGNPGIAGGVAGSTPGAGGAVGNSIVGTSFVTFGPNTLDIRGPTVA